MALPDTGLVLAAGGSGSRLGSRRPKAIVEVAGRPLFLHSLRTFSSLPFVKEIAIALPGHWIDRIVREWGKELGKLGVNFLVAGGPLCQGRRSHEAGGAGAIPPQRRSVHPCVVFSPARSLRTPLCWPDHRGTSLPADGADELRAQKTGQSQEQRRGDEGQAHGTSRVAESP